MFPKSHIVHPLQNMVRQQSPTDLIKGFAECDVPCFGESGVRGCGAGEGEEGMAAGEEQGEEGVLRRRGAYDEGVRGGGGCARAVEIGSGVGVVFVVIIVGVGTGLGSPLSQRSAQPRRQQVRLHMMHRKKRHAPRHRQTLGQREPDGQVCAHPRATRCCDEIWALALHDALGRGVEGGMVMFGVGVGVGVGENKGWEF